MMQYSNQTAIQKRADVLQSRINNINKHIRYDTNIIFFSDTDLL